MEDLIFVLVYSFSYLLGNILLVLIIAYFLDDSEVEDDSETQKVELVNEDLSKDSDDSINN